MAILAIGGNLSEGIHRIAIAGAPTPVLGCSLGMQGYRCIKLVCVVCSPCFQRNSTRQCEPGLSLSTADILSTPLEIRAFQWQ